MLIHFNILSDVLVFFVSLQEILDQVVDIDLVLNLKCQEDSMVKKCASSGVHPCQEFLCMTTSKFDLGPQPDDGNLKFTNYSDGAWREKLRVYAEQVPF